MPKVSCSPWCGTKGHNQVALRGDRPGREMIVINHRGGGVGRDGHRGEARSSRHRIGAVSRGGRQGEARNSHHRGGAESRDGR